MKEFLYILYFLQLFLHCVHYFQSVEDFILLIGTFVAFVAFVLWCCFPIVPKETNNLTPPLHYETRYNQYRKISDMDYNGGL